MSRDSVLYRSLAYIDTNLCPPQAVLCIYPCIRIPSSLSLSFYPILPGFNMPLSLTPSRASQTRQVDMGGGVCWCTGISLSFIAQALALEEYLPIFLFVFFSPPLRFSPLFFFFFIFSPSPLLLTLCVRVFFFLCPSTQPQTDFVVLTNSSFFSLPFVFFSFLIEKKDIN